MTLAEFSRKMGPYLPGAAHEIVFQWLMQYPCNLRITKPRTSKLGDFRTGSNAQPLITINGNLGREAFLITLAHEIAHLIDYRKRKTSRDPHGRHWKAIYSELLVQLLTAEVFPASLLPAIERHIHAPKAASCSDPSLTLALHEHEGKSTTLLKDVPENARFSVKPGRIFLKGELRRTRYRCLEEASGRFYLIHMLSEVEHM